MFRYQFKKNHTYDCPVVRRLKHDWIRIKALPRFQVNVPRNLVELIDNKTARVQSEVLQEHCEKAVSDNQYYQKGVQPAPKRDISQILKTAGKSYQAENKTQSILKLKDRSLNGLEKFWREHGV